MATETTSPALVKQILAALDKGQDYTEIVARYGDSALDAIPELVAKHGAYADVKKHIQPSMLRWEVDTAHGKEKFHEVVAREEKDLRQSRYYLFKAPATKWYVVKANKPGLEVALDEIENGLTVCSAGVFLNFPQVPELEKEVFTKDSLANVRANGNGKFIEKALAGEQLAMTALRGATLTPIEINPRVYNNAQREISANDIKTIAQKPVDEVLIFAPFDEPYR